MGRPYTKELQALPLTFEWASTVAIDEFQRFVTDSHGRSLACVGSGGSMASAHFAALLHRHLGRGAGRHLTPLELLLAEPTLPDCAVLLLSASGRNRDVRAACREAIRQEVLALGVLSTRKDSPLSRGARAYARAHVFEKNGPWGRDGYLATNSLLAALVVLARAYGVAPGELPSYTLADRFDFSRITSLVVLHGGWGSPAATDLESRLHEAALIGVQVADYRNFGHGRHLWLANRENETAVLALETPEVSSLAARTLRLVPPGIPIIRLETAETGPLAAISLIYASLIWTASLAESRGVDPGRPRVPTFGRRMFHLRPPNAAGRIWRRLPIAVRRKLTRLHTRDDSIVKIYSKALERFAEQLASASLGAVVLDYDGTLCDREHRFGDLPGSIAHAICRVVGLGLVVGVATGRGKSARDALRHAVPQDLWGRIFIGYYNGAVIDQLSADEVPDRDGRRLPGIDEICYVLEKDELLSNIAIVEARPSQVTVTAREAIGLPRIDLYTYVQDILVPHNRGGVLILRSGHSVDIITLGVSKLRLVHQFDEAVAPRVVLCIGDQGAWPGNDTDLLGHPYSLSVDRVSSAPHSCWNIAPAGCVGPAATLAYLRAIKKTSDGSVRLDLTSMVRYTK